MEVTFQKMPKYQVLEVGSAHSLSDILRIGSILQFGASNGNLWFRGHAKLSWKLVPKLHRGSDSKAENVMITEFKSRAHTRKENCPPDDNHAAWVCLMQHNKLPTRLLDWSSSILVAAYFAVADENIDEPAVIWVTSPGILNYYLSKSSLSHPLCNEDFSNSKAAAVFAPRSDHRMMIQQGAFTIHNNRMPIDKLPSLEGVPPPSDAFHQIIIEPGCKRRIKNQLDCLCGFNEAYLFPDNLEHLATHLQNNVQHDSLRTMINVETINLNSVPDIRIEAYEAPAGLSASKNLNPLDRVEVIDGEFMGFRGIIQRLDDVKQTAWVIFRFFGWEERRVEIRASQLHVLPA